MFDFATFQYTKSESDVSKRAAFIVSKPSDNYAVLEVVDDGRDPETIQDVLNIIREEYDAKIRRVCAENGLQFKLFKANKVSDLEIF